MEKPFIPRKSGEKQIDLPTSSILGFFYLRLLGRGTDEGQRLICLRSDRLYTVGRKRKHCEIVFDHCCISRRHCQLFLDSKDQRLKLFHGFFLSLAPNLGEVRRRFECERQGLGFGVSLNGVSINGRKLKRGTIAVLSEGDKVALGCCRRRSVPGCTIRCGFIVEGIVVSEIAGIPDVSGQSVSGADLLLKLCRRVLSSGDPVKYLSSSPDLNLLKRSSFHRSGSAATALIPVHENCSKPDAEAGIFPYRAKQEINLTVDNVNDANTGTCSQISAKMRGDCNHILHQQNRRSLGCCSNAKTFFLNRLELTAHGKANQLSEVTLVELLHPVESLIQIFIATFTCDISWYVALHIFWLRKPILFFISDQFQEFYRFLSHCQIPSNLPVTVACHSAEKCWSSSCYDRTSAPYSDYPNLLLVGIKSLTQFGGKIFLVEMNPIMPLFLVRLKVQILILQPN
ncbi:hypothetical protein HPP92_006140 [Vanilla planifolia]|uniref:FHA domain-containing protein n=1 Tax=Vanilla planifolia TaxID=51239 RepID=A0A835VG23_VANPL|nr:hypothetical protein HPP92_006140 [Vanilla planifolia]